MIMEEGHYQLAQWRVKGGGGNLSRCAQEREKHLKAVKGRKARIGGGGSTASSQKKNTVWPRTF